jgi:hypothetical protein
MTLAAVQQHKSLKYSPLSLGIKYTQMNILGAYKQAPPIEPKPYNSIIVSNIPSAADKNGVPPNPTKPWLEMQIVESDPVLSII